MYEDYVTGIAILLVLIVGLILFAIMPDEASEADWQRFNEDMAYRAGEDWPKETRDL